MTPQKPKTAADINRSLAARPDYFEQRRRDELKQEEARERYERVAAPMLEELRSLGFDVARAVDLSRGRKGYRKAVPTLLKWLEHIEERPVQTDIVRALTDRSARPTAAPQLFELFEKSATDPEQDTFAWIVANALSVVTDASYFSKLRDAIREKRFGASRQPLLSALTRMPRDMALEVAGVALADSDLTGHAAIVLRKLKAQEMVPQLRQYRRHSQKWVRDEVVKTLASLERSKGMQ